jgi:hypothetical protein
LRAGALADEEVPDLVVIEPGEPDRIVPAPLANHAAAGPAMTYMINAPKIGALSDGCLDINVPGVIRAGAVTDPSRAPPMGGPLAINDLQSLANELHAQTRREDAQTAPPHTVKSITKQHGRLLYYVRACDALTVHLAPGLVEREA